MQEYLKDCGMDRVMEEITSSGEIIIMIKRNHQMGLHSMKKITWIFKLSLKYDFGVINL